MNKKIGPNIGHNKKSYLNSPVEHIDITSFDADINVSINSIPVETGLDSVISGKGKVLPLVFRVGERVVFKKVAFSCFSRKNYVLASIKIGQVFQMLVKIIMIIML